MVAPAARADDGGDPTNDIYADVVKNARSFPISELKTKCVLPFEAAPDPKSRNICAVESFERFGTATPSPFYLMKLHWKFQQLYGHPPRWQQGGQDIEEDVLLEAGKSSDHARPILRMSPRTPIRLDREHPVMTFTGYAIEEIHGQPLIMVNYVVSGDWTSVEYFTKVGAKWSLVDQKPINDAAYPLLNQSGCNWAFKPTVINFSALTAKVKVSGSACTGKWIQETLAWDGSRFTVKTAALIGDKSNTASGLRP
jgi:hypothetical protein